MATQSGGLIQDQNLNSHCRVSRKKTASVGSQRALADLSNSAKPSTCLALKNHSNKLVAVGGARGEHNVCKLTSPSGGKIKVLIEFPNSEKPSTLKASKKNHTGKLSIDNREIDVSTPVSSVQGEVNVIEPTISQSTKSHQFMLKIK
ncbi:uncharacterized protein LOC136064937 [Quercus suber]|uniref:uncharacterized protein LOC136064937 n=1 Tax=Quercus suber TaxID=58331 RepID=UPI0032DEA7DB